MIASEVAFRCDSLYLVIFTSLLYVGFDRVNDSNFIFKTTKNHHAKWTFMLAPHLLNSRIAIDCISDDYVASHFLTVDADSAVFN